MFVDNSSQKLINAIIFFASETRFCGKIKLFKLLYLADFEAFSTSGASTTGLTYEARPMGPVPSYLMQVWNRLEGALGDAVTIRERKVFDFFRNEVIPNRQFDSSQFTKRELRIMQDLADRYKYTYSEKMIDVTHAQNGAWDKVWQNGMGYGRMIPYELSIPDDDPNKTFILELSKENAQTHN